MKGKQQEVLAVLSAIRDADACVAPLESTRRELYIDNEWLEAILENLALASLSRTDCISLIEKLESLERAAGSSRQNATLSSADLLGSTKIIVGARFDAEFNEFEMRAPDAMTNANVGDTLERAVRRLGLLGHSSAARQIVFFVVSNLEEVVADADDDE